MSLGHRLPFELCYSHLISWSLFSICYKTICHMLYVQSATTVGTSISRSSNRIIILALHFSFRGRHSGKGPAAVSNQSKVAMQRKTDYVAWLTTMDEDMCFGGKGKLYFANHHAGYKIAFCHFKTGICKMHVIVGHDVLVSSAVL